MLRNGFVLEPAAMVVFYYGETEATAQFNASSVLMPSGEEQIYDLGLNFYFSPDIRISAHYTFRNASAGESGDGSIVNNYYFQPAAGRINRGDWIGLELIYIL